MMQSFETKLRERCLRQGIPVDEWGTPGTATKSFGNFLEELADGSAQVSVDGPVESWRQSVCLRAFYRSPSDGDYLLWDVRQEYLWPGFDPVIKERQKPYLSESWRQGNGETYFHTAQRCFWEETGLAREAVEEHLPLTAFMIDPLKPLPALGESYLSSTFPKLPTRRTLIFVLARVPDCLACLSTGHQVVEGNIRSVSEYRPVKEKPLVFL